MGINRVELKKPHHNIYGLSPFMYKASISLCIALWILFFIDVHIRHLSIFTQICIWTVMIIGIPIIIITIDKKKDKVIPYSRETDFQFLGLYNLKDSNLDNKSDVLARDDEIKYMQQVLEDIIFPQKSIKQALCITGPSGYGKSIILNFFKQAYKNKYKIYDFSGNYHEFDAYIASVIGSNIDQKISEMISVGKVIFILDQFERFFFLSKKEQEQIQSTIRCLCKKNTGIIVSLREEYLADFLKRFDMNNLLSVKEKKSVSPCGILKSMLTVIEKKIDFNPMSYISKHLNKTNLWEDYSIKNNEKSYFDTTARIVLEKIGSTLLYCQNQNEMSFQFNGKNSNTSILERKCKILFSEKTGSLFFNKHVNDPLIEQQIIFHMAEFNQKILCYSDKELNDFINKDNNELLDQYYDSQLASCDNYFHAARLLYLLSQARIRQLSIKTQDLENYLFPIMFEKNGHEQFMNIIHQLEKIQLIRKNTEGSSLEYEIAHDFIASTYLNYSSTNMDRNVKGALDLFILEYMDDRRKTSFLDKITKRINISEQNFYRNITCCTFISMIILYLIERFIFNPWTTVWIDFNPYGNYVPAFPLFITLLSGVYIFYMYEKTVKYYSGEKTPLIKKLYMLFAILALMAVFAYPHFLLFNGIGLAIATINIALLLDQRYRQTCRNELLAYGAKSFMMGLVYAFAHIFYLLFNPQFDDVLIFTEFVMFTILLGYGFFVHMTQEFLYARMSDSASEKI